MATEGEVAKAARELLAAYGRIVGDDVSDDDVLELCDDIVEADSCEDMEKRKVFCLHWAAQRGYTALLDRLVNIGNNAEGVTEASDGATPLHLAVMNGHADCAKSLASGLSDVNAAFEAQTPLHLAVALGRFTDSRRDAAMEIVSALIAAGAEATAPDAEGCLASHRAAAAGFPEALSAIAGSGGSLARPDSALATPLHHAALCSHPGGTKCVEILLASPAYQDEAALGLRSACYGTALDAALMMGNCASASLIQKAMDAAGITWTPSKIEPQRKVLLLHSAKCALHAPKPEYGPESAERLGVLVGQEAGILRSPEFGSSLSFEGVERKCGIVDVLRVHDYSYIRNLQIKCERLPEGGMIRLDQDTAITPESYDAAFTAAAAVVRGVDAVLAGDAGCAFACVRPAGHHAGPGGASTCYFEEGKRNESHGFCLLSNAAIGAAHALAVGPGVGKVAIVDFDVHHGNGTEECVRNLSPHQVSTTLETPMGEATFKNWSYKPWRDEDDADNTLFISMHAAGDVKEDMGAKYASGNIYTGMFYPGTGVESAGGIMNVPLGPRFGTKEFRMAFEKEVLPRLDAFKPDIIIISAGFDAHRQDAMNYGLVQLGEHDYFWATDRLRSIAEAHSKGRVVSLLEGGYRVKGGPASALARSVAAHVRALVKSPPQAYKAGGGGLERLEADLAAADAKREELAAEAEAGGGGRRKRRRAAVDYAALDAEMK